MIQKLRRSIIAILSVSVVAAIVTFVLVKIPVWGHLIGGEDMLTEYVYALLWAIAIWIILYFSYFPREDKIALTRLWLLKCSITLGLMLIYESGYGLDAYWYYDLSKAASFDFTRIKLGQGMPTVVGICWFLSHNFPTGNSYHTLKVVFSFFGLMAVYLIYLGYSLFMEKREIKYFYILALYPSILFWSSILGKDPLNLLGVAIFFYFSAKWYRTQSLWYIAFSFIGVYIASLIRTWYALILMLPLVIFVLRNLNRETPQKKLIILGAVGSVCAAMIFVAIIIGEQFDADSFDDVVKTGSAVSHSWSTGGSGQEIPKFTGLKSMLSFLPYGTFTALFRPMPGEVFNAFGLLAGFENLFLLYFFVVEIKLAGFTKSFKHTYIGWFFYTILSWGFLYAFISPQNLGAAVRFKLQILPFVLGVILLLREERLKKTAPLT